jgi:hypothetical protein
VPLPIYKKEEGFYWPLDPYLFIKKKRNIYKKNEALPLHMFL